MTHRTEEMFGLSQRAIELVWSEMAAFPLSPVAAGRTVDRLPDVGLANAARRSALGRQVLDIINRIDARALPRDQWLTLEVARWTAARWAREEEWYWLLFDPSGKGFFAMFAPTAYAGGYLLGLVAGIFRSFVFAEPGDGDRYVGLVRDYVRLVRQLVDRTAGQAERGIYLPEPQRRQSLPLLRGLSEAAPATLLPNAVRIAGPAFEEISERVKSVIVEEVVPVFAAFIALLEDPTYVASCPTNVGLGQYPGGREAYADLIRINTTLDLDAAQVHALGRDRITAIRAEMTALLAEIGFAGSIDNYLEQLMSDPTWRASGDAEIKAVFQRYIDRIEPHLEDNFTFRPKAGYGVAPLPAALSEGMTYGYYAAPKPGQADGLYVYNGANLAKKPVNGVGALTYHELVPGHHFHFSTQSESERLHPLRQHSFFNAYNEGWAEYAATFAGEIGMYQEPEERFGRLVSDAFLTCRLVVDTGLNVLGWGLEQGRAYMRDHGFLPDGEIQSETLRYACDIPGQALGYKLGDTFLLEARERMRAALGEHFHVRKFHDAVLEPGALPLPILELHLNAEIERLQRT